MEIRNFNFLHFVDKVIFKNGNLLIYCFVLACIFSRLEPKFFLLDIFSNLSFQILLGGLFLVVILLFLKRTIAIVATLLLCLFYSFLIFSECNSCKQNLTDFIDESINIKIMTYNISYSNDVKNFDNIKNLIETKRIDILLFQEVSPMMKDKFKKLKPIFPYGSDLNNPLDMFDTIILSKYPLNKIENKKYHILKADLKINNNSISIFGIHLRPGGNQKDYDYALNQISHLEKILNNTNSKFIVSGDLNMTPYSKRFSRFVKKNKLKTYISPTNEKSTWPSFLPNFLGIQIDHFLFVDDIKLADFHTAESFGSDHRPLIAKIVF